MPLSISGAQGLATEILQSKNPTARASRGAIQALVDTGYLSDLELKTVETFFNGAHVLVGSGIEVLRVSLTALSPSQPTDQRPYGSPRRWAGVDVTGKVPLTKVERRDAWLGVWPVSTRTVAHASARGCPVIGSIRGYVPAKLARTITGSSYDTTADRVWIETKKLTPHLREQLFPAGAHGAWIEVPQGFIAGMQIL